MADKVKKVVTSELLNAYVAGQVKPYIDKGDSSASNGIAEERARAEAAESSLEDALVAEASRREDGVETLQSSLGEEIARAEAAEQSIADQINDVVNGYDEHFESLDSSVSSLMTSLDTLSKKERADVQTLSGEITSINDKIPSQASAENQLADKDFVNSSISTATAIFRGTVKSLSALKRLTGDLNDYAYVETTDETTGLVLKYDRYKYSEIISEETGNWAFEYTLNNSSFTSDQWKAITSGITSDLVAQITTNKDAIAQETTSREDAIYNVELNVDTEKYRAQREENDIRANLDAEASRAQAKEAELETAISQAGKIDDVKVDGASVVVDKVANIDLSEYAKGSELTAEATGREAGDAQTLTDAKSYADSCVNGAVSSLLGVSGTLTLKASDWSSGKCIATIEGLNDTDALIINGSTFDDQKRIGEANLFASASSGTVTFTAETTPTEAISLNYFIARGK